MTQSRPAAECAAELAATPIEDLPRILSDHAGDERKSVRDACGRAERRLRRHEREVARTDGIYRMQRDLIDSGLRIIVGVDEVGRGALAGPVTAGATILDADDPVLGLDDSKKLSPQRRTELDAVIRLRAAAVAVAHVPADVIDAQGIVPATRIAMLEAIAALGRAYDHVLVDGNDASLGVPCTAVIEGDAKCATIAAASIVAKVARDALMTDLDSSHPGYGLALNKGYSTLEHMEAIRENGPSPVHRLSFEPCRQDPTLF